MSRRAVPVPLLLLLSLFPVAAQGAVISLDPQPDAEEGGPEAAVHPNGDVLLVWSRTQPTVAGPMAMAAIVDPDTGQLGELHEWGIGFAQKVVPLGPGYLALRIYGPDPDIYPEAFVQRLDEGGQPVGTALSLGPVYYAADAHSTPGGGAVVVAVSLAAPSGATQSRVHAWRFGPDGVLLSGPTQLAGNSAEAVIDVDAAGNLVLAWRNERFRVFARRFSPDLQPLSPVLPVASGESSAVVVAVAPDGRFVVIYRKSTVLWARAYRADASPAGKSSPFAPQANFVFQGDVDVEVGAQGRLLVVWFAYVSTNVPTIQGRVLSLAGLPLTRTFRLARNRAFLGGLQHPRAERLPEGDFLLLWTHVGTNGRSSTLRLRRLSGG